MIIITTYQQLKLTKDNILNFRNKFTGYFSTCPIVVITTSEDDIGFKKLEQEFENVYVIEFNDAPGSSTCNWYDFDPYNGKYRSWIHRFIVPRIFMSIEKGLKKALELNYTKVLHLHSDTFWQVSYESKLNKLFEELDNYMIMGDISISDDKAGPTPDGIHFHPEGLFFNLAKCIENSNYGLSYSTIFTHDSEFKSHNYCSPEALIGQYAAWCIDKVNIMDKSQCLSNNYWKNVKILLKRDYHGEFEHGLVNLKGKQPRGK